MLAIRTGFVCITAACALSAQDLPGILLQQAAPKAARTISTMTRSGSTYLGVGLVEVTEDRAKALSLKDAHGVEVKHVDENSPAAKAGLKEGDVLLDYNGQRVEGVEQFIRMISETPAGRKVSLNVWRGNAAQNVSAVLEKRATNTMVFRGDGIRMLAPTAPMPPEPPAALSELMGDHGFTIMMSSSTRIGIEGESVSGQLAEFFGVKQGVLVRSVNVKSPAEKAGLKAGDVITKVAGTPVMNPREITGAIRNAKGKVAFTVYRAKKEMTVDVEIPETRGSLSSTDRLVLE